MVTRRPRGRAKRTKPATSDDEDPDTPPITPPVGDTTPAPTPSPTPPTPAPAPAEPFHVFKTKEDWQEAADRIAKSASAGKGRKIGELERQIAERDAELEKLRGKKPEAPIAPPPEWEQQRKALADEKAAEAKRADAAESRFKNSLIRSHLQDVLITAKARGGKHAVNALMSAGQFEVQQEGESPAKVVVLNPKTGLPIDSGEWVAAWLGEPSNAEAFGPMEPRGVPVPGGKKPGGGKPNLQPFGGATKASDMYKAVRKQRQ